MGCILSRANLSFCHRMWIQCIIATHAVSPCVATVGKSHTKPRCSPATRSSPWLNAPRRSTKSAVSGRPPPQKEAPPPTSTHLPLSLPSHSPARRALHHVLHRKKVNAMHQLFPRHASVSAALPLQRGYWYSDFTGMQPLRAGALMSCFVSRRESRAHCIDIETAYMQGCEKLDQAVLVSVSLSLKRCMNERLGCHCTRHSKIGRLSVLVEERTKVRKGVNTEKIR